ncbi:MAG TPA: hemolysin III family protein [bacterium]|nr:hemolysin III family protein [bacterium]
MATLLSKDGSVHVTDEVFNTWSAGLGTALAAVGTFFLVQRALAAADAVRAWGVSIYGFGLVNMFLWSALHHGVDGSPKTNHTLRQLDYFAISVMIAGSFTPFCLRMGTPLGRWVLGVVWVLAIAGIAIKTAWPHAPRWLLTSLYIGMGWLGLAIAKPVYEIIHPRGFLILLLGGLFYTVGGIIYGLEKPNPVPGKFGFHEIWHCFVLAGALSHFYVICCCL